jgi:hypothetical protein
MQAITIHLSALLQTVTEPVRAYWRMCQDSPLAGVAVTIATVLAAALILWFIREDCRGRGSKPW